MVRSIAAVLAGFVLIAVLSLAADGVLRAAAPGVFGPNGEVSDTGVLLLTMVYVAAFAIGGCYLAARMAPGRPMLHALALGALGLAFSLATVVAIWELTPPWYNIASLLLVMPYAWIGGRIRERELERRGRVAAVG